MAEFYFFKYKKEKKIFLLKGLLVDTDAENMHWLFLCYVDFYHKWAVKGQTRMNSSKAYITFIILKLFDLENVKLGLK